MVYYTLCLVCFTLAKANCSWLRKNIMNRAQKIAWSYLITVSIGFILSIIAVVVFYLIFGMPKALWGFVFMVIGLLGCFVLMGIGGLGVFYQLILKKGQGKVRFDERDQLFYMRAWFLGYCASYLFFVIVCMTTWFIYGPKGTISVNVLPLTVMGGFLALMLVHSLAILWQYGRREKGEKE